MNNDKITEHDIKLWLGEMFLENRMLQREIIRLKSELEIKNGLLESRPPEQGKEKGETRNNG